MVFVSAEVWVGESEADCPIFLFSAAIFPVFCFTAGISPFWEGLFGSLENGSSDRWLKDVAYIPQIWMVWADWLVGWLVGNQ